MSEDISKKIDQEIKSAMLARDKTALEALRSIKKEFLEAKTAKGGDGSLSDEQAIKIMQRLVKQRKESAAIFSEQDRPELAENELAEAAVIEKYLPKQMSNDELLNTLAHLVEELGATGPQDMGKVMGTATRQLAGKADGKRISDTVRKILNQ